MFKIGEFARLSKVTIDTLRHYDALDLLKPAKVDPFTGYRYYSAKQLYTLNRIAALKELGFSLDEIGPILQDNLTTDQLRGMLKMHLITAQRDLNTAQIRLDRVIARLNYLDQEDHMPTYEVTVKPVESLTIAAIREIVPTVEEMPERCGAMFGRLAQWMATNQLPFGPSMTIYFDGDEQAGGNFDTECSFIIPSAKAIQGIDPEKPIQIRQLDAVPMMATTIVTDDFHKKLNGLTPAYTAIAKWIEENHYRLTGPPREVFHGSPENGDLTAEIQFPVEKG
ncbi:MerR family transcriptional regulator [Chloroflexi bacterium TSY]|nr:MerR family transcriptional regulator [Chloroflexi bacterium TSY]